MPNYSDSDLDAIINAEYNSTLGRNVDQGSLDLQRQQLRANPNYDLFGALKQSDEYKNLHQADATANASSGLANNGQRDGLAHALGAGLGGNLGAWTAPGGGGINDQDIQDFGAGQQFADAYDSTGRFNPEKFSGFGTGIKTNTNDAFLQAYRAGLPGLGNGTSQAAQSALDSPNPGAYGATTFRPSVYNTGKNQNFGGLSWYGPTNSANGAPSFFAQQQGLGSMYPNLYGGQSTQGGEQSTMPFNGFVGAKQPNETYTKPPQAPQPTMSTEIGQSGGTAGFYGGSSQPAQMSNAGLPPGPTTPAAGTNSVFASGQPYSAFGPV